MIESQLHQNVAELFLGHFGRTHTHAAYAPGRAEILGNHTDYNEGFVLSAAINYGTYFLVAASPDSSCRVVAADVSEEVVFDVSSPRTDELRRWSNYVRGVTALLKPYATPSHGFWGMFLGNIPVGSGLSSSAALEMSTALALSALYGASPDPVSLARIGQTAEHQYAGVRCGLLDQITSLLGQRDHLVFTDFRSLETTAVPFAADPAICSPAHFLMCNTNVKHNLVASEYNERREKCESATQYLKSVLPHRVTALRDVKWSELKQYAKRMDPVAAKRATHVVGENMRVESGIDLLENGDLPAFGKLMFESHESSRTNFENSCEELDFLVDTAAKLEGVLGARLSGGGFGGSVVVLVETTAADKVRNKLSAAYQKQFKHTCDVKPILPSGGARIVQSQPVISPNAS